MEFLLAAVAIVFCIGMALSGYLVPLLVGGFIGSFFGVAGFGGAISGMFPGAIVGALIAVGIKKNQPSSANEKYDASHPFAEGGDSDRSHLNSRTFWERFATLVARAIHGEPGSGRESGIKIGHGRRAEDPPADISMDGMPKPGRLIGLLSLGSGTFIVLGTVLYYAENGLGPRFIGLASAALVLLGVALYYLVIFQPSAEHLWVENRRFRIAIGFTVYGALATLAMTGANRWIALVVVSFFGVLSVKSYLDAQRRRCLAQNRDLSSK